MRHILLVVGRLYHRLDSAQLGRVDRPVPLQLVAAFLYHLPQVWVLVHPLIERLLSVGDDADDTYRDKALLESRRTKLLGIGGEADEVEVPLHEAKDAFLPALLEAVRDDPRRPRCD